MMELEPLFRQIAASAKEVFTTLHRAQAIPCLGLRRSARLPVLVAVYLEAQRPLVLLTDRTDRALTLADELALLAPKAPRLFFPEPTPLFYENAAWGETVRRDRLQVLTYFAAHHIPGAAPSAG